MSLSGIRGTLSQNYIDPIFHSKFHGKTGTLNGVRALSGYLFTPSGLRIVSLIKNDNDYTEKEFSQILNLVYNNKNCL